MEDTDKRMTSPLGRLSKIFKNNKKAGNIIFIAGIIGIVLILISYFAFDGGGTAGESGTAAQSGLMTTEQYTSMLEEKLKQIVSSITGSENVTVMVTLKTGAEYVYANDVRSSADISEENASGSSATARSDELEESYILVETSDGGQVALLLTEIAPTVKGVVVVCDGGSNEQIQKKVSDAVTTALDITSKRVCVTGR